MFRLRCMCHRFSCDSYELKPELIYFFATLTKLQVWYTILSPNLYFFENSFLHFVLPLLNIRFDLKICCTGFEGLQITDHFYFFNRCFYYLWILFFFFFRYFHFFRNTVMYIWGVFKDVCNVHFKLSLFNVTLFFLNYFLKALNRFFLSLYISR